MDPTFAGDGVKAIRFGEDPINVIVGLDGDGRTLVATTSYQEHALVRSDALVWRLTRRGALDRTFAGDGRKRIDQAFRDDLTDMVVDARGRPMLLLSATAPGRVVRLRTGGAFDASFADDGTLRFRLRRHSHTWPVSISLDESGRIVVGMQGENADLGVARWLPNGLPDPTYGTNGLSRGSCSIPGCFMLDRGGTLTPDGYVFAGVDWVEENLSWPTYLARFGPTGGLDPTFGTGGGEYIGYFWSKADDETPGRPAADTQGRLLIVGTVETPERATIVRLIAH